MVQENRRNRLGILGGSFDPIHVGHLILAEQACEEFDLDQVYFMPCADQPLKPRTSAASGQIRKAMILAAIEDHPGFGLLDIELVRGGVSYTVDSLEELSVQFPDFDRYFLVGADKLSELPCWKDLHRIGELCFFGVFPRPGTWLTPPDLPANLRMYFAQTTREFDVSSSEIRRRVAEGRSIRYLVPKQVENMIFAQKLYKDGSWEV
jgi:nicotinate-nucleotide adenylyltransferase